MFCDNRRYEKQATGIKKCGKKRHVSQILHRRVSNKNKGIQFNEHNETIKG